MNNIIKPFFSSIAFAAMALATPCNANQNNLISQDITNIGSSSNTEEQSENQTEKDGIVYTCYKPGFASCRVEKSKKANLIKAEILPLITIDGKNCVVDLVEKDGFKNCKRLVAVTIPATVKHIGERAFLNDGKLEVITCLSKNISFAMFDFKWASNCGPFYNCRKISTVKWATNDIPSFAFDAFSGNRDCPYSKKLEVYAMLNDSSTVQSNIASSEDGQKEYVSFLDFAEKSITDAYNNWQKKKDYGTKEQYAERTSAEKRDQIKQKLVEDARNEYINLYAPASLEGTITDYDTEYKVFTISVPEIGNIYAQVTIADRSFFEDNWSAVQIVPVYNIVNNKLTVVSCEYNIGEKKFVSPKIYDEESDNYSNMAFEARKIDLDDILSDESSADNTDNRKDSDAAKRSPVNTAPFTGLHNPNTYALIVGNENYKYVEPVKFAVDDAITFARYCRNTLGVPDQNIMAVQDVTKGELRRTVKEIQGIFEDDGAKKNLIVYYAGHGIPDEKNADSLILPVDASASDTESCYSLQELYNQLGELGAQSVVVYMDACFTGSARGGGSLLANRAGVDFVRSQVEPRGNMVVLSATSASETAQPYVSMGHGIFTYFLLDKLQQAKGNVTLGELSEYVTTKVKSQSLSKAGKRQVPSTMVSNTFSGNWKDLSVTLMK